MLNSIILMGRLVAEPELKTTPTGISVCSFCVACDRNFKSQNGEKQTDFINIVAWRQTAEFVTRYFHKGQLIAVQGSLQIRQYQDKDGNKRTAAEVVADQVFFAEGKRENGAGGGYETRYGDPPPARSEEATAFSSGDAGDFSVVEDDDLPF